MNTILPIMKSTTGVKPLSIQGDNPRLPIHCSDRWRLLVAVRKGYQHSEFAEKLHIDFIGACRRASECFDEGLQDMARTTVRPSPVKHKFASDVTWVTWGSFFALFVPVFSRLDDE